MPIETKITGLAEYGQTIKALFCGDPGSGKTLLSSTFPNPFYISAEGGLMSIARRFMPYVDLKNTDDLREVIQILRQPPDVRASMLKVPYDTVDTIVIDTVDEIQKIFMKERVSVSKHEAFVLQDYGWLFEKMQAVIRALRNLDMNVVFTCHVQPVTDEESGAVSYKPSLAGQTGGWITGATDLCLVLRSRPITTIEDGETKRSVQRYAQTYADHQYAWVKDRSGQLPAEFPINFEDDYKRMWDAIYGGIDDFFKESRQEKLHAVRAAAETRPDPLKPEGDDAEAQNLQAQLEQQLA